MRVGSRYYLYYSGNTSDTVLPERTRHGVAVSTDGGRTFHRLNGGEHIGEPDPSTYTEGYGAGQSAVVEASDGWLYMIYTDVEDSFNGVRVIRSRDPAFPPAGQEPVASFTFGDMGGASLDLAYDADHEEFIVVSNATPGFESRPSLADSAVKLTYFDRSWTRLRSRTLSAPAAGYALGEGIGILTDSRRRILRQDVRGGAGGAGDGVPSLVFAAAAWEPDPCEVWACWIVNNHLYSVFRDWEAAMRLPGPCVIQEGSAFAGSAASVISTGRRLAISDSFTVELWARPDARTSLPSESTSGAAGTSGASYAIFPDMGESWAEGDSGMGISIGTNGVAVYEHAGNYLPALLRWQGGLRDWVHLAVVYTGKTPLLYVNGHLVRVGLTSPRAAVHPSIAQIGGGGYGYYEGRLADIRVWDRALGRGEIEASFAANRPPDLGGLAGEWLARNTARARSAAGTAVADLTVAGGAEGQAHAFSLLDDAGGRFSVDGATGVLRVKDGALLDPAVASSHGIVVRASAGADAVVEDALEIGVVR